MTVLRHVVAQHAEEAPFLWLQRDRAVLQPHYKLADVAKLDGRVEAHIDGLRVAGEVGWELARAELEAHPEAGEVFSAGVLGFESGDPGRIQSVLAAGTAKPPLARALVSALAWLPPTVAAERIKPLLAHESPAVRYVGLAAAVAQRLNPGRALELGLRDGDPRLRARALRAVGEMGYGTWAGLLRSQLRADDLECRFAAAWSLARLAEEPSAVAELQAIALTESRHRATSVDLAVRRLAIPAARRWLGLLSEAPGGARLAVLGLGRLGDPADVPRLLGAMKDPPLARVAGEAFSFITGADLAYLDLETDAPKDFEAGPTEDPADENVALDPDENLPWPDPEKVAKWWAANRGRFSPGVRHLVGKPITPEWLAEVLRTGKQRQRAAAALEAGLLRPKEPLFEVRAPGFRQQEILNGERPA